MTETLRPASLPLRQSRSPAPPPPWPAFPLSCPLPIGLPRRLGLIKTRPFSVSVGGRPTPPAKLCRTAAVAATIWGGVEEGPLSGEAAGEGDDPPTSVELVPIGSEEQFDRIVAEAQQLEESIVVLWMANWCRKCIYLKPKLEKLAADYYPRVRFYCIDVNSVPQRLVNRAGITFYPDFCKYVSLSPTNILSKDLEVPNEGSLLPILGQSNLFVIIALTRWSEYHGKMPTIQMWKDSERQAEVIGGHKSWLVIDDVRRMIENEEQSGA